MKQDFGYFANGYMFSLHLDCRSMGNDKCLNNCEPCLTFVLLLFLEAYCCKGLEGFCTCLIAKT